MHAGLGGREVVDAPPAHLQEDDVEDILRHFII